MEAIPKFVLQYICSFLAKNHVFNLASCSKLIYRKLREFLDNYYLIYRHEINRFGLKVKSKFNSNECIKKAKKLSIYDGVDFRFFTGTSIFYKLEISTIFPESLTELYIQSSAGFDLKLPNLKILILGGHFNQSIDLDLPRLETLKFGFFFDEKIDLTKLPNLKYLEFDYYFNQKIFLNSKLEELIFGCYFNQQIKLPPNLRKLHLGDRFNQPLEFNQGLIDLKIGKNQILKIFSKTLERLQLYQSQYVFAENLKTLISMESCIDFAYFPNLEILECCATEFFNFHLLKNLTKIDISGDFNSKINFSQCGKLRQLFFNDLFNQKLELDNKNLEILIFGKYFNRPINIGKLTNLIKLEFKGNFNQRIQGMNKLKKLKFLKFGNNFNLRINVRRLHLTELVFGSEFNQPIKLNSSLEKIEFGNNFNQPITFPRNLVKIQFGKHFNQPISLIGLNKLESLTFGDDFNQKIDLTVIDNLKRIYFGKNFNHRFAFDHLHQLVHVIVSDEYGHIY